MTTSEPARTSTLSLAFRRVCVSTDSVNGVDLTMVGWIMALVGAVLIVLTAMTWGRRGARSVETTTHRDGTQTVSERRTDV